VQGGCNNTTSAEEHPLKSKKRNLHLFEDSRSEVPSNLFYRSVPTYDRTPRPTYLTLTSLNTREAHTPAFLGGAGESATFLSNGSTTRNVVVKVKKKKASCWFSYIALAQRVRVSCRRDGTLETVAMSQNLVIYISSFLLTMPWSRVSLCSGSGECRQ
jgi:hypothetical protein